jgi:glycosyltransferase involved in cell wall biosynthesis
MQADVAPDRPRLAAADDRGSSDRIFGADVAVLFLVPTLHGGGAERQLCYLAQSLVRLGARVCVGYHHDGVHLARLAASGALLYPLGGRGNYDVRLALRILCAIREFRPGIVHTWLTQMDILGGLAAMATRRPFIISERTTSEFYLPDWKNRLRDAFGRRASAVVANSDGGIDYWKRKTIPGAVPLRVIPNAVPYDEINHAQPVGDDRVAQVPFRDLILVVGRLTDSKNLDTMLPALRAVLSSRRDAVAVFLGDGPMLAQVHEYAHSAGLAERMRAVGFTDDVYSWMKRASVFLSLSRYEGNPNTVLEAAAAEVPLVISDIAAHREILDDDSAWFVPVDDAAAAAQALSRVLEGAPEVPVKRAHARERVASRSSDALAADYLQLYREVLAAAPGAPC